jgi:hypothetical protein
MVLKKLFCDIYFSFLHNHKNIHFYENVYKHIEYGDTYEYFLLIILTFKFICLVKRVYAREIKKNVFPHCLAIQDAVTRLQRP